METTTSVVMSVEMVTEGELVFSVINVNDCVTKFKFHCVQVTSFSPRRATSWEDVKHTERCVALLLVNGTRTDGMSDELSLMETSELVMSVDAQEFVHVRRSFF